MLCKVTHCAGRVLANIRLHQLYVILSTVLQVFRFTHETLTEASYGNATAYTLVSYTAYFA